MKDALLIDTKRIKGKAGSYFSEMLFSLVQEESHTPSEQSSGLSGPSHSVAERRGAPCVGETLLQEVKVLQGMDGRILCRELLQRVSGILSYCRECTECWVIARGGQNAESLQEVYRMLRNG